MRIAYISADAGVPVFGAKGCSVHVQEMIRALRSHGANVELLSNSVEGDRPSDFHDLVVHELPRPVGKYHEREISALENNESLTAALEKHGPYDLLYERYSLWSFAAMEHARKCGMPAILEVNAPLIEEQERYRYLADRETAEKVAHQVFNSANHVIAVSRQIGRYVQQFRTRADRVHVIPNGINPDRFPSGLPALFPTTKNTFTVGFLGSLKPWHGLQILVEAFDRMHRNNPFNLRLLIVGDGPERNQLLQELENRDLKHCSLLPGQVASHEVGAALASMDVGVAPYPNDDFFYFSPLKVLEYMAAALPVVASNIGQISEIIRHEETGILCPAGDENAIVKALERLRDSANLRVRLGSAARAEVLRNYNWKSIAGKILNFFSEVQVV
jgi:glycosyltransferase involved in cell wall biosynthesis